MSAFVSNSSSADANLQAESVDLQLAGQPVLRGVSARFVRGWTAIVGPNGAGKSSLLRVLAGLQQPQAGRVLLHGRLVVAGPGGDDAAANAIGPSGRRSASAPLSPRQRAQGIAWLGQSADTTGDLTVRETVALGRLPHRGLAGAWQPGDTQAVDEAMALAGCSAWAERRLPTLSGGERQRALLARALATGAPVLLLDEPTTHLDPPHQLALAQVARQLGRQRTVVTVVHDLPLALAADHVLLLAGGRVVAQAPAHEPALHRAIEATFDHAVRISHSPPDEPRVLLNWQAP